MQDDMIDQWHSEIAYIRLWNFRLFLYAGGVFIFTLLSSLVVALVSSGLHSEIIHIIWKVLLVVGCGAAFLNLVHLSMLSLTMPWKMFTEHVFGFFDMGEAKVLEDHEFQKFSEFMLLATKYLAIVLFLFFSYPLAIAISIGIF